MAKEITLDELALMIKKGFDATATKEEAATKEEVATVKEELKTFKEEAVQRFNKVDKDISWIHGSLEVIQREVSDIKEKLNNVIYRHELDALRERIARLERKTGLSAN